MSTKGLRWPFEAGSGVRWIPRPPHDGEKLTTDRLAHVIELRLINHMSWACRVQVQRQR